MIDRPEIVHGKTYKLKPPIIDESVYVTINDAEIGGAMRPVEVFINSKNMQSFQWISLITRLLSAHMRTAEEFPVFVIDEMLETYDPHGGYMIPKTQGVRVNSIVAHIGWVLKQHCIELGVIPK
jgi:hypothetical protein